MTEQEAIERAARHSDPGDFVLDGYLDVLADMDEKSIERIYSRLNGDG